MKKVIKIITVAVVLTLNFELLTLNCSAQDIHFTMYDAMPITTNPATAGVFNGDFRGV